MIRRVFSRKARKQRLAAPSRFYGDGNTIHSTGHIDVVTRDGIVTQVWFRCQQLPFQQADESARLRTVASDTGWPRITGIELRDPEGHR